MKTIKLLLSIAMAVIVLVVQAGSALAAPSQKPAPIKGTVQGIVLETDVNTAVTTVKVTLADVNNVTQTVRIDLESAIALRLVINDENGMPVINPNAIGMEIVVKPTSIISKDAKNQHPVGDALAAFFSDITDYDTIMAAHKTGVGFGVITQALWLTKKLNGDSDVFLAILKAKETGDYSAFVLKDGSIAKNWGQFRKAVLGGDKKNNLGAVMPHKDKDKNKDNNSNVHGNGNGANGNGHANDNNGNGHGNGNNKDKDKGKGKDKDK